MRKQYKKTLEERREERARKWEEERVAQVEEEIQRQTGEVFSGVVGDTEADR